MNAIDDKVIDNHKETDFPPMPLLENWHPYCGALMGNVYGHPEHPDGELVQTTRVKWLNEPSRLAETVSRMYRLGKKA